jgi:hypothetical protein
MYSSSRKRAIRFQIPHEITTDYLTSIAVDRCPILGLELKYGGGKLSNNSASVDRIVPELGYVVGNVQIISNLANMMKSCATKDQLITFADWVHKEYK